MRNVYKYVYHYYCYIIMYIRASALYYCYIILNIM